MQQTGTLKKRRRRNLAKVKGLGTIPYDETMDMFTGRDLFNSEEAFDELRPFKTSTGNDTIIRFSSSSMMEHRRDARSVLNSRTRVTRDPSFHNNQDDAEITNEILETGRTRMDMELLGSTGHTDRTHFLDKYTMQRLRQLVWFGIATGSFPWKWNKEKVQIEKWSPSMEKLWWVQWFFITLQTTFLTGFQLYAFLESIMTGHHESYRGVFMSSFSFLWYSYCMLVNVNLFFYKEKIRVYINTLLNFNHTLVQKYLIHLDGFEDGGRLVINVGIITNVIQVFISVSLFLVMPYQPWYLFSMIYPQPWYCLIPGAFQEFLVVGQAITSFTLLSWVVVAHASTVLFWLQETHNNNDSDYTSDLLRTPQKAVEMYRTMEILTKCFNESMSPMAIPTVKFIAATALIPCGYVLIRSMNHTFVDEFPGILTYPLGVLDCVTVAFVITSMPAKVFDLGCSFIDSWSRTKQKDFRRILMSCPTLKTWVAKFYFISVATTITFFKTCFDLITDCIIAF